MFLNGGRERVGERGEGRDNAHKLRERKEGEGEVERGERFFNERGGGWRGSKGRE